MGVAVLHPQDVLADRGHAVIYRHMKPRKSPNPSSGSTKSNRRKNSPEKNNNKNSTINSSTSKNLVMGQVKILKRGEGLKIPDGGGTVVESGDSGSSSSAGRLGPEPEIVPAELKVPVDEMKVAESEYLMLSSTGRLGPEPEMLPKQVGLSDFYAGSACISSPPPSSLPFPYSFVKKHVLGSIDDASSDLRRLLRLEI
ncbi:uncharacterized protein LOC127813523 [Diospyros lotus]|uniref:uncharacterized protein LOC127813523 n=1 Tax=Diospyros lotus TaxID=55363 RepID=UPI002251C760|nr:uncharacterized protein LOC127813523 [Diospyros lotus]